MQHSSGQVTTQEALFQARLRARDGVRPQSTLAILAGYEPRQQPVSRPCAVPGPASPSSRRHVLHRSPRPVSGPKERPAGDGQDRNDQIRAEGAAGAWQMAFAGLAAVGFAGLAALVLAGFGKGRPGEEAGPSGSVSMDPGEAAFIPPRPASVSAIAIGEAADPEGQSRAAWFDYSGMADYLRGHADISAAQTVEVARLAQMEADRLAGSVIAETATNPVMPVAGPSEEGIRALAGDEAARIARQLAAEAALAEEENRAIRMEAARLAQLEAQRLAALRAAQARIDSLERALEAEVAARQAAEAEARRFAAEREALIQAEAQAREASARAEQRLLVERRARLAAEAEVTRLAALEAQRAAEASQTARLAEAEARRIAEAEALRLAAAAIEAPRPVLLASAVIAAPVPVAKPDPGPQPASLKPQLHPDPSAEQGLAQPETVAMAAGPGGAGGFIAERVSRNSPDSLGLSDRLLLANGFDRLLATGLDGHDYILEAMAGEAVRVRFEQTRIIDPSIASVPARADANGPFLPVSRSYEAPIPVSLSVMCREVSYAIEGFERGRFAACQQSAGRWLLARPAPGQQASL